MLNSEIVNNMGIKFRNTLLILVILISFVFNPNKIDAICIISLDAQSQTELYKNDLSRIIKNSKKYIPSPTIKKIMNKSTNYLDSIQSVNSNGKEKILIPNPLYRKGSKGNEAPYIVFETK